MESQHHPRHRNEAEGKPNFEDKRMDKSARGFFKALVFTKVLDVARETHNQLHRASDGIRGPNAKKGPDQVKVLEDLEDIIDNGFHKLMQELSNYEKGIRDL